MEITITVGKNRKDKKWKTRDLSWLAFVTLLEDLKRRPATSAKYAAMTPDERAEEKDVGGYVAGSMVEGARKALSVLSRQVVTLDIDFADLGFENYLPLIFNFEYYLHTTHSHSDIKPRYRLIIPIDEAVSVDKYEAIARRIAGDIDIELFDTTTFQASRLMYWPSATKDGAHIAIHNKGEIISAEDVLDQYDDWSDTSKWPLSDKAIRKHLSTLRKQSDPTQKRGVVGAFCKEYNIEDAIESFLSDIYESGQDGRYTFLEGSTANGLVIYDDIFAYSHHSTDPASMLTCNAFDLVRLHLFGDLDTGSKLEGVRLPSFVEMSKFSKKIACVNKHIIKENIGGAFDDFDGIDVDEDDDEDDAIIKSDDWLGLMQTDKNGRNLASAYNLDLILENDPIIGRAFAKNVFDQKQYVTRDMPWRQTKGVDQLRDVDLNGVRNHIDRTYNLSSNMKLEDSLALAFQKNSFHPVKDYLNALTWDKTKRVDTLLIDYFGVDDSPYHREAIRKVLVAGVARIFRPACKFDLVLTLVSNQGGGKSTFIKKLGGEWFSDSLTSMQGKEAFQQLQGAWIIELAELSAMRKSEVENVKHFITKQSDSFRLPYGRVVETFDRQCIFMGTTNRTEFLSDDTGNRRFMPIQVVPELATKSVFKMTPDDVAQIWAEAKIMFEDGEKLYLSDAAEKGANASQRSHSEREESAGAIEEFLEIPISADWYDIPSDTKAMTLDSNIDGMTETRQTISTIEIWVEMMGKSKNDTDRNKTRILNSILRKMEGWTFQNSPKRFGDYGKQKYFSRDKIINNEIDIF